MCGEMVELPLELYKGSTLSSYLFVLIMDNLTPRIQDEVPWCLLFVANLIIIIEMKHQESKIKYHMVFAI